MKKNQLPLVPAKHRWLAGEDLRAGDFVKTIGIDFAMGERIVQSVRRCRETDPHVFGYVCHDARQGMPVRIISEEEGKSNYLDWPYGPD